MVCMIIRVAAACPVIVTAGEQDWGEGCQGRVAVGKWKIGDLEGDPETREDPEPRKIPDQVRD